MNIYDFNLDLEAENSHTAILKMIQPNTNILEFGCASGIMTKHIKEELKCKIGVIEKFCENDEQISKYCELGSCLGENDGDIEKYIWEEKFKDIKFDYILFADVLEHLYSPQIVLEKCKNLLNENGSIIISIPNISHNAVIIDLINGKFKYRDTGLLDKTHIRFFTYLSLLEMIDDCNLIIEEEKFLINVVENTEFINSYNDVPDYIATFLKNRELSEVYQFVMKLKCNTLDDISIK